MEILSPAGLHQVTQSKTSALDVAAKQTSWLTDVVPSFAWQTEEMRSACEHIAWRLLLLSTYRHKHKFAWRLWSGRGGEGLATQSGVVHAWERVWVQTANSRWPEQVAESELVMLCWGNDQLFNVQGRLQGSKLDHGGLFQGYGKHWDTVKKEVAVVKVF